MERVFKYLFGLIMLLGVFLMIVSSTSVIYDKVKASDEGINSKLVSVEIKDVKYNHGTSAPVQLTSEEIFSIKVTMVNTGTAVWGEKENERGASLLNYPDYSKVFGTFFIIPGQGSQTSPGNTFTWNTKLRAPTETGNYTMQWRLADWPVGTDRGNGATAYNNRAFYGDIVTISIIVVPRADQPPTSHRVPKILDQYDFEYEGSFRLPKVTSLPNGTNDEKNFHPGGIAMRKVEAKPGVFEKRMILQTGTPGNVLYECAIPELGKFVNNKDGGVPVATLRTVFGVLPRPGGSLGTIWYDEQTDRLFWTNYNSYYTSGNLEFPVLTSASLAGGVITQTGQWWYQPGDLKGAPFKSFWGGVTVLSDNFAEKYTGGRKLALGFGGEYSINASASFGPALAAVSLGEPDTKMDILPIMYYGGGDASYKEHCVRDGNYLHLWGNTLVPPNPWTGTWTTRDVVRSGVFIDLPDKKGYITFAQLAKGRIGYDYGGYNWFGSSDNAWYFYDLETLGSAAKGEIPKKGIIPSSYNLVTYPYDAATVSGQTSGSGRDDFSHSAAGSYFDYETRRLYLLVGESMKENDNMYANPVVHVYHVIEGYTNEVFNYPPTILGGQSTMSLFEGYDSISTSSFKIMSNPESTVDKVKGSALITWNQTTNKFDIATGLTPGVYPVVIKASNSIEPDDFFTFTLKVTEASVVISNPIVGSNTHRNSSGMCTGGFMVLLCGCVVAIRNTKDSSYG